MKNKIADDVDDEVYEMTKRIQKKYKLTWAKARDEVNRALRIQMLAYPEKWVK